MSAAAAVGAPARARATDAPTLEFYFEFASPYAYLSSERVEALCARLGLALAWKPFMLGPILARTGARPLFVDSVRGAYARHDCLRWARLHGIPLRHWADAPTNALKAARGGLHLAGRPSQVPYIHACYRAHFVAGRDLFDDAVLGDIVRAVGEDEAAFRAAIAEPALKQCLVDETEAAYARGVFGAPTFFLGDEMLWGNDRLPIVERLVHEQRAQQHATTSAATGQPPRAAAP